MNLSDDIKTIIGLMAPFAGNLPTAVTLPSGAVVQAGVGVANQDDSIMHEAIITGSTRKLTFVTAQIGNLKTQQNVFWNGQLWGVLTSTLEANGAATVCFVGTAF